MDQSLFLTLNYNLKQDTTIIINHVLCKEWGKSTTSLWGKQAAAAAICTCTTKKKSLATMPENMYISAKG